jgi:ribosomal protein S18 acetylase RimI-like enzyme
MQIREMRPDDFDFALSLTSAEGWMSTSLDFQEILANDPHGSFVGEHDGERIGMVCTVAYERFGFVGNLIVLPAWRGDGLGEQLMVHAMNYLEARGIGTQMLDGVEMAVSLYEKLGFRKRFKSLRLEGRVEGQEIEGIESIAHGDLRELVGYDLPCFGSDRRVFLETRLTNFPSLCKIARDEEGGILGYMMGSESGEFTRIGPWVVTGGTEVAESLLRSFAASAGDCLLKIGVLENNSKALDLLHRHGFAQTSFSWRMSTTSDDEWTCSQHLYAICSPARG